MESKEETVNIDEVRQEICNMVNNIKHERQILILYGFIKNYIQ